MNKNSYVYFVTNWNHKVLYVGVTVDLERRVFEHKNKIFKGFTNKYNVEKLVYFENFYDVNDAIKKEKQIKNWLRTKKNFLVERMNPDWKDLSLDWYRQDPSTSLGMTKTEDFVT